MSQRRLNRTGVDPTAATGDAADVLRVLEWARANGIELSSVKAGNCAVTLTPAARAGAEDRPVDPRDAIYQRFGGQMLKDAMRAFDGGGVPKSELQPAIGRGE